MLVEQFEDKNLSHYSYAILIQEKGKVILIDPARNPQPYYDFAAAHDAKISAVIETHPHADFVSSHVEISKATGANIYASKLILAHYAHQPFDDGDSIEIGNVKLTAHNTPGHSPDSISILLEESGIQKYVFTGDTLFIGDCGRPDLREGVGNIQLSREVLAKQMYHSLRDKLMHLNDDVIVYPAHGAGTLCGKALSKANSGTIGEEKQTNWSLQPQSEEDFVRELLAGQPFVPAYFPYDVELNRKGAQPFEEGLTNVLTFHDTEIDKRVVIVDARKGADFRHGHLPNSINIIEGGKFETWLGSIVNPGERFYLAAADQDQLERLAPRCLSIGYEPQVAGSMVVQTGAVKEQELDVAEFKSHLRNYTIVDVRNPSEVAEGKKFEDSIAIPLGELKQRAKEIPTDKPIVVHCAGGTRSATGTSILKLEVKDATDVFDLGEEVKKF
ncbi:MAG: sulfurtransferase [Sphingobacteriaceae bacterium]|jgi:glyoxylase-like metal-dependent hydrolase (beta-lactamase superfamily II)/rhodanese-related sulfurtransferase|nr:sulfurtransferase [Sphingobacteriaceae bacterium]